MAKKRPLKESEKKALNESGRCDCGGTLDMKGDAFKCNKCGKTYEVDLDNLSADSAEIIEENE